jgi:hypothetical protein
MKWFADYLESQENRYKLARRLCVFVVAGSIIYTLIFAYYGFFLKN